MSFALSEEQALLRQEIVTFSRKELNEGTLERDREAVFPRALWLKCGQMGLQGLPVPEEYGGSDLDPTTAAVALEALGYGCRDGGLVFTVCAHLLACVVPIWRFGSEEQKRRYLPDLCQGKLIAANAMSEPGSGSDAFSMATKAEADGSGFRLSGTKIFISNSSVADLAVVFAVTDETKGFHGGITAFLVEKGSDGFQAGQRLEKMGLRTSPIGEVVLENAYVPQSAVLGGVGGGAGIFTYAMDWERVGIAATHVGNMDYLIERAIDYSRTREQFGRPISKFQAISHKIADMKVQIEAARLLVYKAADLLERSRRVSLHASIAKLFVSECLRKTAMETVQIFGGYGYMTDYEVERALRDSVGSTIYSGTSELQRELIARWLGM